MIMATPTLARNASRAELAQKRQALEVLRGRLAAVEDQLATKTTLLSTKLKKLAAAQADLAAKKAELAESRAFDMRKLGFRPPDLDLPDGEQVGAPRISDGERWANYHQMLQSDPAAANRYRASWR